MRAMVVANPAFLDRLRLIDVADAERPGAGEILVRVHATSLNFHDYLVVNGSLPLDGPRVPMSDAGGDVVETGEGSPPSPPVTASSRSSTRNG